MINTEIMNSIRVILIGGSSNVGKSTIAQSMALKLGWSYLSTDSLARHPGRPWRVGQKVVPEHVVDHYKSLLVDELFTNVLQHYQRIWSKVEKLITVHASDGSFDRLILEGSALWPELVATLDFENVRAVWLTANDDLFRKRIYQSSQFDQSTSHEKLLIQKFLDRTILYNMNMMSAINRLGLMSLIVGETDSVDVVSERCLEFWN